MKHFDIDQLATHLLGEADDVRRGQVTDHLATGCRQCNAIFAALGRLRRVGSFDAVNMPPDGVLRTVKALSGFSRPARPQRRVSMLLSFDSLRSPALAGARSMQSSSRHLVFYSQNFALDLRMDFERSMREVVVVGQLLSRDWGPLPDVPAYLVSDDRVVSHSVTGRLGEFHMECRPRGPMHLQLAVNDEELIDVELDRRMPSDLRPVLLERDHPGDTSGAAPPIHSRGSDTDS